MAEFRDRIQSLTRVPASQIKGAAWNWRTHPDEQRKAVSASMVELGFIDPLDCRKLDDGTYELIDGHLRRDLVHADVGPDTMIPIIVTDLTEDEAKKAILVKDPLAAMAGESADKLRELLGYVSIQSDALQLLVGTLDPDAWRGGEQVDINAIGEYDPDKETFSIRVNGVLAKDKDRIIELIEKTLDAADADYAVEAF